MNAVFLKTTNGLFFFQVITSSLVILNEVYPFVHGAIKHKSLVKAFESRDHKLIQCQMTGYDEDDIAEGNVELHKVHPVMDENEKGFEFRNPVRAAASKDCETINIMQIRRELDDQDKKILQMRTELDDEKKTVETFKSEISNSLSGVIDDIYELRTEIEPLLSGHDS